MFTLQGKNNLEITTNYFQEYVRLSNAISMGAKGQILLQIFDPYPEQWQGYIFRWRSNKMIVYPVNDTEINTMHIWMKNLTKGNNTMVFTWPVYHAIQWWKPLGDIFSVQCVYIRSGKTNLSYDMWEPKLGMCLNFRNDVILHCGKGEFVMLFHEKILKMAEVELG